MSELKSNIGREWLFTLRYTFAPVKEGYLEVNSIEKDELLSLETEQMVNELNKLFKRKQRNSKNLPFNYCHRTTRELHNKKEANPYPVEKAVELEIKRLLQNTRIELVNDIEDDVFIQPTVITVKKDRSVKIALDARALI